MASGTFNQKMFKPTAPDKGSFPLDHEGLCRRPMLRYLECVTRSEQDCRELAKDYLDCRMRNRLMDREEWPKLGFHDNVDAHANSTEANEGL